MKINSGIKKPQSLSKMLYAAATVFGIFLLEWNSALSQICISVTATHPLFRQRALCIAYHVLSNRFSRFSIKHIYINREV